MGPKPLLISDKQKNISDFLNKRIQNILVITSDIYGLGKSEEIRIRIKENKKTYFHFREGGILTKGSIFDKLEKLLVEINDA